MANNPREFFSPLAIGAPEPVRSIPWKPSRMIHFMNAANEKMRARVPQMLNQVDVLLGNLEEAVASDEKLLQGRVSSK